MLQRSTNTPAHLPLSIAVHSSAEQIMPHPTIADHDPSADDRDNYVTPRGRARSTEGTVYAAPPARGGRACSSFSGASGGVEFSAVRGGDGTADGARARSGAQAAARAVSGVSKSRGAGCKVGSRVQGVLSHLNAWNICLPGAP